MARHLEILPQCAAAINQMELPPGVPVAILSASTATESELRERDSWVQHRLGSSHRIISGTGHWLHLERPDVVAAAVRELAANHTG
jgi:pimeloyl-ACP methyl ester carboxylesterase